MKTFKLKVGQTYIDEDKSLVKIIFKLNKGSYPYVGIISFKDGEEEDVDTMRYTENGECSMVNYIGGGTRTYDLKPRKRSKNAK